MLYFYLFYPLDKKLSTSLNGAHGENRIYPMFYMNNGLDTIWKHTLSTIETQVPRGNFLTLFKNTALLSLEDNIATIAVPSTMVIDLIQKRYLHILKEALKKEIKHEADVMFVPKDVLNDNQAQGPLFTHQQEAKTKFIGHLPRVRADYTFETLGVSSTNQLAFIAATTVAKNIGSSYNPLFIYGPTGVGKTHLMQAIANHVYSSDPTKRTIYITSEEFTNEVVEAIRTNQTHSMKRRFRSATLLIIDDVQFLAGKDKIQEELFHTFNILIDNGSQIVLSSDRPPSEIKKLEKRLSSRFSGGLTADIEPPDFELKTAILLIKAKKYGIELPIEVAKHIAEQVGDTRGLEGTLLRIMTESNSRGYPITLELAKSSLSNKTKEKNGHVHPDDVIEHVCLFYSVKQTQIKGPRREASLVRARQVAMYILKKELELSFVEIGNILGGRDHTTIMHGVGKVENLVKMKPKINEDILGITKNLRE